MTLIVWSLYGLLSAAEPLVRALWSSVIGVLPMVAPSAPSEGLAIPTGLLLVKWPPRKKTESWQVPLPFPVAILRHFSSSSLSLAFLQNPSPKREGTADLYMASSSAI